MSLWKRIDKINWEKEVIPALNVMLESSTDDFDATYYIQQALELSY